MLRVEAGEGPLDPPLGRRRGRSRTQVVAKHQGEALVGPARLSNVNVGGLPPFRGVEEELAPFGGGRFSPVERGRA